MCGRINNDMSLSSKECRPWVFWDVSGFPYPVLPSHLEIAPNPLVYHEILKEMAKLKKLGKQGSSQMLREGVKETEGLDYPIFSFPVSVQHFIVCRWSGVFQVWLFLCSVSKQGQTRSWRSLCFGSSLFQTGNIKQLSFCLYLSPAS